MKCPKCGGAFPTTKTWVRRKVTLACSRCGLRWRVPWKRGLLCIAALGFTPMVLGQGFQQLSLLVIKMVDVTDPFWDRWLTRLIPLGFMAINLVPLGIVLLFGKRIFSPICDDLCKMCGYDLRGIDSNVCPECGPTVERRA